AQCVRREVKVKSIPVARIIDSQNGIGYIQMTGFQQSTVAELDEALRNLHEQGMRSLVWDLRGNPGGLLESAVEVLDRFIADGIIVSTRGRVADQNSVRTAHSPGTWQMPLVLLIDGHSASASEIVAGAIRDHQRGRIVGRTSFGKWSVQSLYDLPHATAVRITTAKFYSPKGTTWGKIGLSPDIEVDEPTEPRPGRGVGPELKWSAGTDGALTSLALCRESGHVIVADEVGTLSQLDRFGKISAMTRLPHAAHVVAWSEDGAWGAALVGDSDVVRFNRELQIEWTLSLSD
ncbi:Carboxy-terminal-processing protease (C-terminal-processing protease), partial [Durusdinium trenchii]